MFLPEKKIFSPVFYILIIFFIFFSFNYSNSQDFYIHGQVKEYKSEISLPFVTISIDDSIFTITDIDGSFKIPLKYRPEKITFYYDMYSELTVDNPGDYFLNIKLIKSHFFSFEKTSSLEAINLISNILNNKKKLDSKYLNNYSYSTYNKLTLSSGRNNEFNKIIKNLKGRIPFKLYSLSEDQHLFIVESFTEKKFLDERHQKEIFTGAKSSSITIPSIFLHTWQMQSYSIYDNYIKLNNLDYISPLSKASAHRYTFNIIKKLLVQGDTISIVKYHGSEKEKFPALKGLLFISTKKGVVIHHISSPLQDGEAEIKATQSFSSLENESPFPWRTKTQIISKTSTNEINYIIEANTFLTNFNNKKNEIHKKEFDETILEYSSNSENTNEQFWNSRRTVPLSIKDSSTYQYYKKIDKKHFFQSLVSLGQNLSLGVIPIGKVNFEIDKIINTNLVEGLRLGVGLHTNGRFSEKKIIGGYFGYGCKDQRFKYGLRFSTIIKEKAKIWYHTSFHHELTEAGGLFYSFDIPQYPSEVIRRLRLRILDLTTELNNNITTHPLKYMDVSFSYNLSSNKTTYNYYYKDLEKNLLKFEELGLGIRYAFGEKIIRFLENKKSLGTKFPVFYCQFTKGFNGLFGNYSYNKINLKVEQTIKFLNIGTTTLQLAGGVVSGDVPYNRLYIMKGSLKSFSIVVHNAFETMAYNEFLSNKFLALYITHNFGRIFFTNTHFQPSISILHNTGVGILQRKENHLIEGVLIKSMENGYLESGSFVDNAYVFSLTGLKVGIGGGFFYRYGPYARTKASENIVFKFSTNLLF